MLSLASNASGNKFALLGQATADSSLAKTIATGRYTGEADFYFDPLLP